MTDSSTGRTADVAVDRPWGQAALVGALTLIPVRSYPRWLRSTLLWGPPVAGMIGFGYVAASTEVPSQRDEERESTARKAILFTAGGAAAGAVCTGVLAVGFWADERIERGLRTLRVPLPRVVMAAGAAASTAMASPHGTR